MKPLPLFSLPFLGAVNTLVSVSVTRRLPGGISGAKAKESWLSFVFEKGGGLPICVFKKSNPDSSLQSDFNSRLLLPIFARETLIEPNDDEDDSITVGYRLTELGPVFGLDIEPDSHLGVVSFSSSEINWKVEFVASRREDLWQSVTKYLIGTTCDNFVAYLDAPLLYTCKTNLEPTTVTTTTEIAMKWRNFFRQGAGLPVNPPLVWKDDNEIMEVVRIPPFLRERVESPQSLKNDVCQILYKVVNPGLFTFQVLTHRGRVRFIPQPEKTPELDTCGNGVLMLWEVELRPIPGWKPIVQLFTDAVISTFSRCFKVYLEEPNATISLLGPRGSCGKAWAQVPKATWLGLVLSAHLNDHRSTKDQMVSLLQPWTWGIALNDDGDIVARDWKTGSFDE